MARHRTNAPAPLIVGPVYRCTTFVLAAKSVCEVSIDYMDFNSIVPTLALSQGLLATWIAALGPSILSVLPPVSVVTGYSWALLSANDVPTVFASITPAPGTVGANQLPSEVAANILKQSTLKGQHGRGALRMPSVPVSYTTPATSPDNLNALGLNDYNSLGMSLQGTAIIFGGANCLAVISTRPAKTVPPAPTPLVTRAVVIGQMHAQSLLGTMRRRKFGRGI